MMYRPLLTAPEIQTTILVPPLSSDSGIAQHIAIYEHTSFKRHGGFCLRARWPLLDIAEKIRHLLKYFLPCTLISSTKILMRTKNNETSKRPCMNGQSPVA